MARPARPRPPLLLCTALLVALLSGPAAARQLAQAVTTRIVGGTQTSASRYPFIVSLRDGSGNHYCGGSLIAPRVVLTAAHCIYDAGLRTPTVSGSLGSSSLFRCLSAYRTGVAACLACACQPCQPGAAAGLPITPAPSSPAFILTPALQVHIGRSFTAAAETGFDVRKAVAAALHPQYVQATSANDVSGRLGLLCRVVGSIVADCSVVADVLAILLLPVQAGCSVGSLHAVALTQLSPPPPHLHPTFPTDRPPPAGLLFNQDGSPAAHLRPELGARHPCGGGWLRHHV